MNQIILDDHLEELAQDDMTLSDLYDIQFRNPPSIVRLPGANTENTYDIDLSKRTINSPGFLSVNRDHRSTVVYFKVDRYFEFMDLSNTICVIEYIIPNSENRVPFIYVVPYFDTMEFILEQKMVFPWVLGGPATQSAGVIEYAIRFFRLSEDSAINPKIIYDLRTLAAKSEILTGLEVDTEAMKAEYDIPATEYEYLITQLSANKTYWHTLE